MPDVKFTLTTEEQQTLAKLREVDSQLATIDATAAKAGRSIGNVEAQLGRLSKTVNFHGSRSSQNIAGDLLSRIDPTVAGALLRSNAVRTARSSDANGLRAEVQRLRSKLENDARYAERAASVQVALDRRLAGNSRARSADRASIGKFISTNALGDASDPLTQLAARVMRQKMQAVDRVMGESLRVVGGNTEILRLAASKGINTGDPGAVRSFVAEARSQIDRGHTIGAQRYLDEEARAGQSAAAHSNINQGTAWRAAQAQREANRARIAEVFARDDEERETARLESRDRTNLRASRVREVRDLRSQRRSAELNAAGQVISGVAGAAATGIYAGEQVLGDYNERMGTRYFGALAGIEPTFREVMGLSGNSGQQKQLRQKITNAAIANGRSVGETSSFYYDVFSAAGNLPQAKQEEIIKTALRFQNVAGGELPIIGQAMTTMENLYGPQVGSTDRMASIIKKAVDYGRFSPTGFAKLSPEAFSQAALRGIPMEEAAAMMAVVSNRSGRDENMFTGSRYTFAMMGKAADEGLVSRDGDFLSKLRELKKASPAQLQKVFGMEGVNVASNARDMIDDIDALAKTMRATTGAELGQQQNVLLRDPVNSLSRLAQTAATAGDNILPSLFQSGDPEAMQNAGEAIKERLATAGQEAMSPATASITSFTHAIERWWNRDKYIKVAYQAMQAGYADQKDPASRHQMQINALGSSQVQVGREYGGLKVDDDWRDNSDGHNTQWDPIMSGAADVPAFEQMVTDTGASDLTAEEYGRIKMARDSGDSATADGIIASAKARSLKLTAAAETRPGLGTAMRTAATFAGKGLLGKMSDRLVGGASTIASYLPNGGKIEDAFNKATINSAFAAAKKDVADAQAEGDPIHLANARRKLMGMHDAKLKAIHENDGHYDAVVRQDLAADFTGGGGATDANQMLVSAVKEGFASVIAALAGNGSTAVKGAPAPTTRPTATAPPTVRGNPTTHPTSSVHP